MTDENKRLTVGDAIPDIAMLRPDGSDVRVSDFAGRRLVLFLSLIHI